MMKTMVYYVSAHGYGHGVRTCDILNMFCSENPDVGVYLVTGLPEGFLRSRLKSERIQIRHGVFDVGMVQLDSVKVDMPATFGAVSALYEKRDELVATEAVFLKRVCAGLVVVDMPAIPVAAAKRCGLPCVAIGNFTWNWIYSPFAEKDMRWTTYIDMIRRDYALADLLLRLPFAEEMVAFARREDVALLAEPGVSRRGDIAMVTKADADKLWVLLSFTELDWGAEALDRVSALTEEYEFFSVKPLVWPGSCIHAIDRVQFSYSDVLASCDFVVSKPGYGLVSECIVNRKPLLYVDRDHFLEYPILVESIERYLQNQHIPQDELYGGELGKGLGLLQRAPVPSETLSNDGARAVCERLMTFL